MDAAKLYFNRFSRTETIQKPRIWRVLCRQYFQRYIGATDVVVDLGAGYCEFINQIHCGGKIAVDVDPDLLAHADANVRTIQAKSTDLHSIENGSVDVVFTSNFLEHLTSKDEILRTLSEVHRILRPNGRVLILQPNIRLTGGRYWDYFDHHVPLTDRSLQEALWLTGFAVTETKSRFLPFTTKQRLPQHPLFIWLYLRVPPAQWILGKQSWIVAGKSG